MAAAASDSREGNVLRESHELASPGELFNINLVPSDLFFKFRRQTEGFRVGLNFKQATVVLKPMASNKRWKFVYEPWHGDIQLLSKKISLTKYLNIQFIRMQLDGSGIYLHVWVEMVFPISEIKQRLACAGGVDLRIGWRADYIPLEIEG